MGGGEVAASPPWERLRRIARTVARQCGPAAGAGLPTLLRHPVWTERVEQGAGTGVVVVPGFGGVDASMLVLRTWLHRRGYAPIGAALGLNLGCTAALVDRLERTAAEHAARTGGPVVLLGHSRGGLLSRMVAVRRPELVAGLVMLGSPVLDPLDVRGLAAPVLQVLLRLSALGVRGLLDGGCLDGPCRDATALGLAAPLDVPALAFFSREDGVVAWQACRDPAAEWVEVTSSHTGMGTDPVLYTALARWLRLAGARSDGGRGRSAPARTSGMPARRTAPGPSPTA
ncbi:alpha/beta hydrolase [Pseudonocardia sp. TRM90224]|uniref:alpha/beta hydrolase n=1 Tax=Pseudonocardia sp. TRM90224 TaxID=2812678 RepID=UPI001E52FF5F|nr:alpha/beta hydrolase [Pseudonocardia sp. TRM90224]